MINVRPITSIKDMPNGCRRDTELLGKFSGSSCALRSLDPAHFGGSELCHAVPFSSAHGAVTDAVLVIFSGGAVAEIAQSVIVDTSIEVPHLFAIWSWADESCRDKSVHTYATLLPIPVKTDGRITKAGACWRFELTGQSAVAAFGVFAETVDTSDAASVRDLVVPLPADDRSPFLFAHSGGIA